MLLLASLKTWIVGCEELWINFGKVVSFQKTYSKGQVSMGIYQNYLIFLSINNWNLYKLVEFILFCWFVRGCNFVSCCEKCSSIGDEFFALIFNGYGV